MANIEIKSIVKNFIRSALPVAVLNRARHVRDAISIHTFHPRIIDRMYGDVRLRVQIKDSMSAAWYDREVGELPEFTFLKNKKLQSGALVFDLGAHQAVVALIMAKMVGDRGRVIAVEAGNHNFTVALENKLLNHAENLSIIRAAVADKGGSMLAFTGGINGAVSSSGESVSSLTIDELTESYGKPDVVWLDVEGYECNALAGAAETLKHGPNWHVEVHSGCGLESFGGSAERIWELFRDHGYDLYGRTSQNYSDQFLPISEIPKGHCYLIAVKSGS